MKQNIPSMKYGFRPEEAAAVLGAAALLNAAVAAGWLRPVIQRHKLTLYDGADLARVWNRILGGELPFDK
jgi:hypothetical protein